MFRRLRFARILVKYCWSVLISSSCSSSFGRKRGSGKADTWGGVGRGNPTQIGLARLVTDHVTFAYLSDVYILEEYQGKGLGTWLLGCVDEVLGGWKELRRVMLMTSGSQGWYERVLGVKVFEQGRNGLVFMNKKGEGSVLKD